MSEFQPLIDELYREQIRDARKNTPEERFLGSLELIDLTFAISRSAIDAQMKDASVEEREREWQRRLEISRRLDESGQYSSVVAA